jgi:hypothetical protein
MRSTSIASESENFDAALTMFLSVSHDELKRREDEWKKQRKAKGYKRVKP